MFTTHSGSATIQLLLGGASCDNCAQKTNHLIKMPPASPIWAHFTKIGRVVGYEQERARCNYCGHEMNAAVRAAKIHLETCIEASDEILQGFFGETWVRRRPNRYKEPGRAHTSLASNARLVSTSVAPPSASNTVSYTIPQTSRVSLPPLNRSNNSNQNQTKQSFADRISINEQEELELLFAQSIFRCGLTLSLPDLQPIKDVWKRARPAFILPSPKRISTSLLNRVYEDTNLEVNARIQNAENLCLISDGWTNIVKKNWTNYILTTPKPVFLSAQVTGYTRQDADKMAQELEKIINKLDVSRLSAIITSTGSVTKKAWRILEPKYPRTIFVGCVSHSLHILIRDILNLNWAIEVMNGARYIVKLFKKVPVSAAILKRNQLAQYGNIISLKPPRKKGWVSKFFCLKSLQTNKVALNLTISELENTSNIVGEIKTICLDDENFWNGVDLLVKVLEKLMEGIKLFDNDEPQMSKIYEWYTDQLRSEDFVFHPVNNSIRDIMETRWKKIYHPVMQVAYLLDPERMGRHLPPDAMTTLAQFIQKYYPTEGQTFWAQILQYKSRTGPFDNLLAWNTASTVDHVTWWQGNFKLAAPELTQVATRILTIPTASPASKRNWSAFSYTDDRKMNQITSSQFTKLLYIYSNYQMQQPFKVQMEAVLNGDEKMGEVQNQKEADGDEYEDFESDNSEITDGEKMNYDVNTEDEEEVLENF